MNGWIPCLRQRGKMWMHRLFFLKNAAPVLGFLLHLRVLYAFDPRRYAVLLLGGDKTGKERWYKENVPKADRLYDEHLKQIRGK